jgi:hypothetical protein
MRLMTNTDPFESRGETNESERPRNERKERVLHTRISHRLAEDIGRMADDLRVPVSNLVRNVLEEVFSVVETVTDNVGELIEDVMDEAGRARERSRHVRRARERRFQDDAGAPAAQPPREDPPDVLGWQPLILARAGACADCAKPLARGERAYVGVGASGPSPHTLCADCLDARRHS